MPEKNQNPLTFVTSTVGNAAGGVAKTAGGVVGATGRGLGDTVTYTFSLILPFMLEDR